MFYASASLAKPDVEIHLRPFRTFLEDVGVFGPRAARSASWSPLLAADIDVIYQAAASWDPSSQRPSTSLSFTQWLRALRLVAASVLPRKVFEEEHAAGAGGETKENGSTATDFSEDDEDGMSQAGEDARREEWARHAARFAQRARASAVSHTLLHAGEMAADAALFLFLV